MQQHDSPRLWFAGHRSRRTHNRPALISLARVMKASRVNATLAFSRATNSLLCFPAGLVPEQKSEIPEAGEAAAEGPDTDSRLPRCHDEEYLSWRQQGLSTLSPSSQQHKWHKSLSPGEAPLRRAGRSRNFIIIDTRRFARNSPIYATRRHSLDYGK